MNQRSLLRVGGVVLTGALFILSCDLALPFIGSPGETPAPPTAVVKPTVAVPPTPTRDPGMVSATANEDLKIYAAPATAAQTVGQLSKGDKARVVGKTAAGDWWQIMYLTGPAQRGWIAAKAVTVSGPVETIPVLQPPAAPAPASPTGPARSPTPPRATPKP